MYLLRDLFVTRRLVFSLLGLVLIFIIGDQWAWLRGVGVGLAFLLVAMVLVDYLRLFRPRAALEGSRATPARLSNGDDNPLRIDLANQYPFDVWLNVIDEVPHQFQIRDQVFQTVVPAGSSSALEYSLRPTQRGEYDFGRLNIYASSRLGLVERRYQFGESHKVPVYPAFLLMRKYSLYAHSQRLVDIGVKKVRRLGQSMEFDQIRPYVIGDDYRTINWKATARSPGLMVNQYQDQKSQQVLCLIDMGRVMEMPFDGMTLLDYSINASLILSSVAIQKDDKAGVIAFSNTVHSVVKPDKRNDQMDRILETLYSAKTKFKEADYEALFGSIRRNVHQRSLLILFTNFESRSSMHRQLRFLRHMARHHVVVVVFFSNTEMNQLESEETLTPLDAYVKTVAEQYEHEKRQIVAELRRYGIYSILTEPARLNVDTINQYLELKSLGVI